MKNFVRIIIAGLIFLIFFTGSFMFLISNDERVGISDSVKILRNVNKFGNQLKRVSLLNSEASEPIEDNYSPFVDSRLIDLWTKKPENAPGKLTSSPKPEKIEIRNIKEVEDSLYNIFGDIILTTNSEEADKEDESLKPQPFNLLMDGETKKIVAFNDQKTEVEKLDISISYSSLFSNQNSLRSKRSDFWSEFSDSAGRIHSAFYLSDDYFKNTNFEKAYIAVGSSAESRAVENCSQGDQVSVNGYDFAHKSREEGAAGNFYKTKSYKRLIDDRCVAIESVVHTTNINNYPEGEVREFDKKFVDYLLESIVRSVKIN